jgi:hypothetical protein
MVHAPECTHGSFNYGLKMADQSFSPLPADIFRMLQFRIEDILLIRIQDKEDGKEKALVCEYK